jgi:hypothetical protein
MKISTMTSKQAAAAIAEKRARQREVVVRLGLIEPSGAPIVGSGPASPGAPIDPLFGAGVEYRRCVLEGSPAEFAALVREHELLSAEAIMLGAQLDALEVRRRAAEREEAHAAAPAKAKKLLAALPDVLDRVDQALNDLAAALDAKETNLRELHAARELADGESYFTPDLVRRVWASQAGAPLTSGLLRRRLSTRTEPIEAFVKSTNGRMVDPELVADCRRCLPPPEPTLIQRLRARFEGELADEAEVRREIDVVRTRLIAAGKLDELEDVRAIAIKAVEARHQDARTRAPAVEAVSRGWFEPASKKLGATLGA